MKKLIALVMALLMAMSCTALAEDITAQETESVGNLYVLPTPFTMNMDLSINESMITMLLNLFGAGADQEVLDLVLPLINALGMKGVTTDAGVEGAITLNGQPILSLNYLMAEDQMTVLSDLFPNYALALPLNTATAGMQDEDILALFMPHFNAVQEKLKVYVQAPETGEFTVQGKVFPIRGKLEMTTDELTAVVKEFVQGLQQDEKVVELFAQMGIDLTVEDSVPLFAEEEAPAQPQKVTCYLYLSEDKTDGCLTMEAAMEEMIAHVTVFFIDEAVTAEVLTGEDIFLSQDDMRQAALNGSQYAVLLQLAVQQGEGEKDATVDLDAYLGMYLGVDAVIAEMENGGFSEKVDVYFLFDHMPLITLEAQYTPGGEMSGAVTMEGKTEISLVESVDATEEELMAIQMNMYGWLMDISNYGLNNLIANAAAAMPQEIIALVTYLTTPVEPTDSMGIDGVNK